jgi:hypothetical protein
MLAVPALPVFFLLPLLLSVAVAQTDIKILEGAELTRVVPPGFYFKGLSAPTQMRNAAAARVGERYVVVGLVDTSGYSADVRERYQGFFITDSPITVNGSELPSGAYGFGYTNDGKLNILDLAGKDVLSLSTTKDNTLRRPRPLIMSKSPEGVRLYAGRDYAVIAFK